MTVIIRSEWEEICGSGEISSLLSFLSFFSCFFFLFLSSLSPSSLTCSLIKFEWGFFWSVPASGSSSSDFLFVQIERREKSSSSFSLDSRIPSNKTGEKERKGHGMMAAKERPGSMKRLLCVCYVWLCSCWFYFYFSLVADALLQKRSNLCFTWANVCKMHPSIWQWEREGSFQTRYAEKKDLS